MTLPDPVGNGVERLFLLGSAMYCSGEKKGAVLAELLLEYADSTTVRLPLRKGIDLDDWYAPKRIMLGNEHRFRAPDFKEYSLFLVEKKNPHPERRIRRIGVIAHSDSALSIFPAVTLERRK